MRSLSHKFYNAQTRFNKRKWCEEGLYQIGVTCVEVASYFAELVDELTHAQSSFSRRDSTGRPVLSNSAGNQKLKTSRARLLRAVGLYRKVTAEFQHLGIRTPVLDLEREIRASVPKHYWLVFGVDA